MKSSIVSRALSAIALTVAISLFVASFPAAAAGAQPYFTFPWAAGEQWRVTQGPHQALTLPGVSTTSALDLQPTGLKSGCSQVEAPQWVLPVAPGTVVPTTRLRDQRYVVTIDHGGGWASMYMHLGTKSVAVGQRVTRATKLGHPACLGGSFTGRHLHLGILKDGNYVSMIGMSFSGWVVLSNGSLQRGREIRARSAAISH